MKKRFVLFLAIISLLINNSCTDNQEKQLLIFEINFLDNLVEYPLSGRALLILSADTLVDPDIPNPFNPFITIGMDFVNIEEGQQIIITKQKSDMFKTTIDNLNGYYSLRAIIDTDTTSCLLYKDGILYSDKYVVYIDSVSKGTIPVTVNNVMSGFGFNESDSIHLLKWRASY